MTIHVYYGKGKSVLPAIMPYHILHAFEQIYTTK